MTPRLRDGLLAVGALVTLLGAAALAGATAALTELVPAILGVVGSLLLEAVLVRYPERTRELWERPIVQGIAFVVVASVGIVAVQTGVDWLLATLAWGLLAYLVLLGVVLAGYRNPVAVATEQ